MGFRGNGFWFEISVRKQVKCTIFHQRGKRGGKQPSATLTSASETRIDSVRVCDTLHTLVRSEEMKVIGAKLADFLRAVVVLAAAVELVFCVTSEDD